MENKICSRLDWTIALHPFSLSHLQLSDPGAVPVGLPHQLDEELPVGSALQWWRRGGIGRSVRSGGDGDGGRRVAPSPVEDLLDSPFDWQTLEGEDKGYKECVVVVAVVVWASYSELNFFLTFSHIREIFNPPVTLGSI